MTDGWHKKYGTMARGLVTTVSRVGKRWSTSSSAEIRDSYGFAGLRLGNVHRNPGLEIIASGNGPAVIVLPSRSDLTFVLGDVEALDACAINLGGDERDEVVIVGPKPAIWSAR